MAADEDELDDEDEDEDDELDDELDDEDDERPRWERTLELMGLFPFVAGLDADETIALPVGWFTDEFEDEPLVW